MSEYRLVAMRLADMVKVHPSQDNSKSCSKCGERVGLYPTAQQALRAHPGMKIICARCAPAEAEADPPTEVRPAGSWDDIAQEIMDSQGVAKA